MGENEKIVKCQKEYDDNKWTNFIQKRDFNWITIIRKKHAVLYLFQKLTVYEESVREESSLKLQLQLF